LKLFNLDKDATELVTSQRARKPARD